jgi:hypothetical protein
MIRSKLTFSLLVILLTFSALISGCSSFTSIERADNGQYIMTGWQTPGPVGFLWIGEYDKDTRTMKIIEKKQ